MLAYCSAKPLSFVESWVSDRWVSAAARAASGPRGSAPKMTGGSMTKPPICAVLWPSVPLAHASGGTPAAQFLKKSR
jgi:hypothetical protein